jgi:hypothetical protein
METGLVVLDDVPVSDGTLESPVFDGVRLVVDPFEKATVNTDSTRWEIGNSDTQVVITAPSLSLSGEPVTYLATPADYRITITEEVVGESAALFGLDSVPMRFTVENITAGESRQVVFLDRNEDGVPNSSGLRIDYVDILENDGTGTVERAWHLEYRSRTIPAEPGDEFVFRTFKLISEADVFEFEAVIGLATDDGSVPVGIELLRGYPNPFSDAATIQYSLSAPSEVTLDIFNIIGQRVGRIDGGYRTTGLQSVRWQPGTGGGGPLAPGVYFARLTAESGTATRSMVVPLIYVR